jgi:hypothetical protein
MRKQVTMYIEEYVATMNEIIRMANQVRPNLASELWASGVGHGGFVSGA